MSTQKFATNALHAGHDVTKNSGTRAVPIYQTSSYVFNNADHAANLFGLAEAGFIYTRLNNPTNDVLEQRLATLEGGIGAVVTASGASAISTTLLTLLRTGDHIVASNSLYGGTYNLLSVTLPRLGITTTFVDPSDPQNFTKAAKENTRAFFVESLGNPKLDVLDLKAISAEAKAFKVPFIVDNTVATPYLLNPIKYGADIVIHSLTKYIAGNGTSLGGVIIDAGNFDWANGKFPEFTEPSAGYHGLVYHEALGNAAFIAKARIEGLRDFGAALSPFNAFQIIQGLETLPIRIKKHSENALVLAEWLEKQDEVVWVNYPGLKSNKYYDLAKEYLPEGQSGIITFGLKGGFDAAKKVVDETKLFSLLANIGDTKSLIIHPASTTHQQLSEEDQLATGVSKDLVRLSVGIEDVEDLIADLQAVFESVTQSQYSINKN
ncbi:O-acetylhomoserine aminocarboxypropyltransferase/cysteine synthase family protein [Flavobacterium johnsoniae]|jgi:O-acetylhomoserine (thiol)-lyase|uniref:O-acetylhomoserine/O-acetylserine sulfhydrylase n=1 Tax=Flavobacterium johnsoniae (strain ATCC 17061 / DSM 2064 / JCM 8514 / BCRC 14874 / CCUG 350202 / NBRC 14942 / NCIMB 11054 / UW101) TaxID=376686 RepID=A5FJU3_FLAJ1|nr:O-acetylhomoserine aminocarboxypropyltransferase/cysteine synthase family protein [Flavobacterium johnsoniae]ABQ04523.1 O-acetylhomoserine/O-acetylserine sulfhydrylase [Flavobacterium johnsoniae UW101]OXE97848.1 O-acetylhomoserine aminocarboxypropyltransferase [Flavobacterium johnsoniae UW101]WQG83680.1 O-acetylhomoserine aminocarboxypropyltransferase/cysteine synthase family protein [Flavobacterium johnsoniae UW101]SHK24816.1 O-acetylhomoserine sulfhydrylase [Flavobacterium johnsoniae]